LAASAAHDALVRYRLGARLRMPMTMASKMHALVNDEAALKVWISDRVRRVTR
jgi:hypothetical protein